MSTKRIIQCVGTNEQDTAHLRLLMRVARKELRDTWTWGTESRADLVVVDTLRLIGDSAMRRAAQRGIDCAQVIGANDPKPAGLFLRRPLQREPFVSLLNKVGAGGGAAPDIDTWSDEFLDLDLGRPDLSQLDAAHPSLRSASAPGDTTEAHADSESMRFGEALPDVSAKFVRAIERIKSDHAVDPSGDDHANPAHDEGVFDPGLENDVEAGIDEDATYPLIYYLEKGVLAGPARIALPGLPSLLVDPDEQLFWSKGSLPAIEEYARVPLRFGDWLRLDRYEFQEARTGIAARPYARLIWMDAFIHSKGFLARHLDPGGDYRLTNRLDLTLDYPRAFRVGAIMGTPRKLHEIARVSAVGLAEVFDVINAYEAIGYVESTQRERVPPKGA
jgi:hypothetical protein